MCERESGLQWGNLCVGACCVWEREKERERSFNVFYDHCILESPPFDYTLLLPAFVTFENGALSNKLWVGPPKSRSEKQNRLIRNKGKNRQDRRTRRRRQWGREREGGNSNEVVKAMECINRMSKAKKFPTLASKERKKCVWRWCEGLGMDVVM